MRRTQATNRRDFFYKYYKVDRSHNLAVPAWKCSCGKITDLFCSKCSRWLCENHILKYGEEYFCSDCAPEGAEPLSMKEKRKIRKARLY